MPDIPEFPEEDPLTLPYVQNCPECDRLPFVQTQWLGKGTRMYCHCGVSGPWRHDRPHDPLWQAASGWQETIVDRIRKPPKGKIV